MSPYIDRDLDIPLYQQLSDKLSEGILNHVWRVGECIPSENELVEAYDVSRTVVRAAISDLVYKGLLKTVKGKGTFVIENRIIERSFQEFKGFYEQMEAVGIIPITKVLVQKISLCSRIVSQKLGIPWGTEVFELERVRFIGDDARYIVKNFIPYDLCPGIISEDFTTQSLYKLLEGQYGVELLTGNRSVSAVAADERQAEYLGVNIYTPLIILDGVSFSSDGKPVEYFIAYHRGDRTVFTYEVHR